jgi:hypothetical protein
MTLLIPAILPDGVALTDDKTGVTFAPAGGWRPAHPDPLAVLTRLARRTGPARVLAVARKHGPLGVCRHGLLPGHRRDCRPLWQRGEPEPLLLWTRWARLLQDMVAALAGAPLPPRPTARAVTLPPDAPPPEPVVPLSPRPPDPDPFAWLARQERAAQRLGGPVLAATQAKQARLREAGLDPRARARARAQAAVAGWLRWCAFQSVVWGTPPRLAHAAPGLLAVAVAALVTGGPGRRCATCGAVGAGRTQSGRVARVDRGWYCSPACREEARRRTKREAARRRRARRAP